MAKCHIRQKQISENGFYGLQTSISSISSAKHRHNTSHLRPRPCALYHFVCTQVPLYNILVQHDVQDLKIHLFTTVVYVVLYTAILCVYYLMNIL